LNESNLVKGLFHHQSCDTIIPSSTSRLYKSLGPLTLKSPRYKGTKPNCNGKHLDVRESRAGKKPNNDVRSFSHGGGDKRDVASYYFHGCWPKIWPKTN
jgi:hypothetical protein